MHGETIKNKDSFSPIYRLLPTDCNSCTRNNSKTTFVVYLTVTISQIYWRNCCKSQKKKKPPGWPLIETRFKYWFPRAVAYREGVLGVEPRSIPRNSEVLTKSNRISN